ncbi:MAG TPA: coproporphyrinogen III oxidase, partial [Thermoanaerobaculia bacterium]
ILEFMTQLRVQLDPQQVEDAKDFLATMMDDGIVTLDGNELRLVEAGKPFLRNAAVFFDSRLRAAGPRPKIFSQAI